eukprot:GHVR01180551.1.p1 GENE.GHVR01180551.1~~GHVR01180551.1.p1  ORF type:complete len:474 (-),score=98.56 GHVR01180551.1:438-1859(-)
MKIHIIEKVITTYVASIYKTSDKSMGAAIPIGSSKAEITLSWPRSEKHDHCVLALKKKFPSYKMEFFIEWKKKGVFYKKGVNKPLAKESKRFEEYVTVDKEKLKASVMAYTSDYQGNPISTEDGMFKPFYTCHRLQSKRSTFVGEVSANEFTPDGYVEFVIINNTSKIDCDTRNHPLMDEYIKDNYGKLKTKEYDAVLTVNHDDYSKGKNKEFDRKPYDLWFDGMYDATVFSVKEYAEVIRYQPGTNYLQYLHTVQLSSHFFVDYDQKDINEKTTPKQREPRKREIVGFNPTTHGFRDDYENNVTEAYYLEQLKQNKILPISYSWFYEYKDVPMDDRFKDRRSKKDKERKSKISKDDKLMDTRVHWYKMIPNQMDDLYFDKVANGNITELVIMRIQMGYLIKQQQLKESAPILSIQFLPVVDEHSENLIDIFIDSEKKQVDQKIRKERVGVGKKKAVIVENSKKNKKKRRLFG